MNQSKGKHTIPTWLDGRTIAMLTTTITVALTLGTMMQTAHARLGDEIGQLRQELRQDMNGMRQELRQEMNGMRQELRADIEKARADLSNDINRLDDRVNKLDDRLRSVEAGVTAIQTTMVGFDTRLRVVEQACAPCGRNARSRSERRLKSRLQSLAAQCIPASVRRSVARQFRRWRLQVTKSSDR